jgi:hypothetical protein
VKEKRGSVSFSKSISLSDLRPHLGESELVVSLDLLELLEELVVVGLLDKSPTQVIKREH